MTIVTRFYPNGEFTHGVDTSHRRHRNPPPQTSTPHELIPVGDSVCLQGGDVCGEVFLETADIQPGQELVNVHGDKYTYLCADMEKHIYAFETADGSFVSVTTLSDKLINYVRRGELTPLGSSSAGILQKTPKTRATPKSLTKRLARRIRNACFLLEQKYSKDCLSFLTLTLPDFSQEDLAKCAQSWGKMVHEFCEWLRYRLSLKNIPLEYVYCTEIQTKRLEKRHEYALHLHIAFRGRYDKKAPWSITPKQVRKQWVRVLKRCVGHGSFKRDSLENLQRIKRSLAGYLSKYMSKGNCSLPKGHEGAALPDPRINWGSISRSLSQEIDRATISIRSDGARGNFARLFISGISKLLGQGIIVFYREGLIELFKNGDARDTRYLKVGVGRFACPITRELLEAVEEWLVNNY